MKKIYFFCALALNALCAAVGKPLIENVLFIISDDLKVDVMGCYGSEIGITPNIDRLAASGMVFDRAYCQGVWCAPSRQSFMYSRYTGNLGVTMGEFFKNNDYYTARVGKIFHMRVPGDIIDGTDGADVVTSWTERFNSTGREAHTPGDYACLNLNVFTDKLEGRQTTAMPHRMFVTVQADGDGSDQPDYKTAVKTIELLRQRKNEKFFIGVGMVRPHYPMVAPRKYFKEYDWRKIKLPHVPEGDTDDIPKIAWKTSSLKNPIGRYPDNQRRMWQGYFAALTFVDDQVGRILDEVDQLGLRDTTAIVFTSDHGYHLGEHTFWEKSMLHENVARVPLIICAPGMRAGRSAAFVELLDIYPTMADLAGLDVDAAVQGRSLKPILLDSRAATRDAALTVDAKGAALRSEKWAYMRYVNGEEELYDMEHDPRQYINQAGNPEYSVALNERRSAFEKRLQDAGVKLKRNLKPQGKTKRAGCGM
jgi:iduronate 2-sulfatase